MTGPARGAVSKMFKHYHEIEPKLPITAKAAAEFWNCHLEVAQERLAAMKDMGLLVNKPLERSSGYLWVKDDTHA